MEGTGACGGAGTCKLRIRDTLNQHTPGLPWANYYVAVRLNHTSLYDAASDLPNKEYFDIHEHQMPLMVLLNANPPDGTPYCLQGYCAGPTNIVHYITANGYAGTYTGSDGSATTYYRDSWYKPADHHSVSLNCFADCIYFNDGAGSCSGDTDVIY